MFMLNTSKFTQKQCIMLSSVAYSSRVCLKLTFKTETGMYVTPIMVFLLVHAYTALHWHQGGTLKAHCY